MPNFDQMYSQILGECEDGNLILFLDSIFGFLYRKSDFFQEKSNDQGIVGLHPGQNKNLLLAVFNKWDKFAKGEEDTKKKMALRDVPIATREEVVASSPKPAAEKPVKKVAPPEDDPPINGADLGHYKWSQTESEVELTVVVSGDDVKGKDVEVDCTTNNIKIKSRGRILVEGNFFSAVNASELRWNMIPGSQLVVHLEKRKQSLWPKFLQSEKEPTQLTNIDAYQELSESDKCQELEKIYLYTDKETRDKILQQHNCTLDWKVDPVLKGACQDVVSEGCDASLGSTHVLSCLMSLMNSQSNR